MQLKKDGRNGLIANAKQSTSNTSLKKLNAELSMHLRVMNDQSIGNEDSKKRKTNKQADGPLLETVERKRRGGAETKLENSNSNLGMKGNLNRVQSTYGLSHNQLSAQKPKSSNKAHKQSTKNMMQNEYIEHPKNQKLKNNTQHGFGQKSSSFCYIPVAVSSDHVITDLTSQHPVFMGPADLQEALTHSMIQANQIKFDKKPNPMN